MKLNLLQRWAVKAGIPVSLLNEFAKEYYGYPIPNEEGKYPEWWYRQERVPITFRDAEVPKEIIKRRKSRNTYTSTPKVYVKVREGKVVEIVGKEAIQTVPDFGRRSEQHHYEATFQPGAASYGEGGRGVECGEIIHRVNQIMRDEPREEPRLSRATSVPTLTRVREEDDIMSFIHDDESTLSHPIPTTFGAIVNPGPLLYDEAPSSPPFRRPHPSTMAPTPRNTTFPQQPSVSHHSQRGPALPSSPRPTGHRRTQTMATDNVIPGYSYYSTTPPAPRSPLYRRQHEFRPIKEDREEDEMSEWSGYEEGEWEEEQFGRTADFRRAAAERLKQYRREK